MNHRLLFPLSLATIYLVWGSSYLVTHVAMQAFSPFLLSGLRNLLAGGLLLLILRWRGQRLPTLPECGGAGAVGALLCASNALISVGMLSVETGIAAVMVATVPLFSSLISAATGSAVRRMEWLGITLGLAGIALLNGQQGMRLLAPGNIALLLGALSWAWGSHLSLRLPAHPSILMATALQISLGGVLMLVVAWGSGASLHVVLLPTPWLAFLYLSLGASLLASCAYMYLIRYRSPAIAVSYAYANPIVALLLGVLVLGEHISLQTTLAMGLILLAVALVFRAARPARVVAPKQDLEK